MKLPSLGELPVVVVALLSFKLTIFNSLLDFQSDFFAITFHYGGDMQLLLSKIFPDFRLFPGLFRFQGSRFFSLFCQSLQVLKRLLSLIV